MGGGHGGRGAGAAGEGAGGAGAVAGLAPQAAALAPARAAADADGRRQAGADESLRKAMYLSCWGPS